VATLDLLRCHWRTHRSPSWLFPAPTRHGTAHSVAHDAGPVTRSSLQSAFHRGVVKSGLHERAHVHTLRHYAESRIMPTPPEPSSETRGEEGQFSSSVASLRSA
jgi:integrase